MRPAAFSIRLRCAYRSPAASPRNTSNIVPGSGTGTISTGGALTRRWRRDGKELYYLTPDGDLMSVAVRSTVPYEASRPTPLFRVELARTDLSQYEVSADGQRFLINAAENTEPLSVMVDVNWTAGLRKP